MDWLKRQSNNLLGWVKPTLQKYSNNVLNWINPKPKDDSYYLAQAAYDPEKYSSELSKRGLNRDASLSNEDAQVYTKGNQAYVSYRGTSKLKDLAPDLDIARGKRKHESFDQAVEIANTAKNKYGNVKVVGHSLGGTKALHASERLNLPAEVYNPGTSPLSTRVYNNQNIVIHKNPFDPISKGVSGSSVQWWRSPTQLNPHYL